MDSGHNRKAVMYCPSPTYNVTFTMICLRIGKYVNCHKWQQRTRMT